MEVSSTPVLFVNTGMRQLLQDLTIFWCQLPVEVWRYQTQHSNMQIKNNYVAVLDLFQNFRSSCEVCVGLCMGKSIGDDRHWFHISNVTSLQSVGEM